MDRHALDVRLNLLAQGTVAPAEAMRWFESHTEPERRDVLGRLVLLGLQAGIVPADGQAAVDRSGMRTSLPPAVLMRQETDHVKNLMSLPGLPVRELGAAFQLLVLALASADGRQQREQCQGACVHWWHHLDQLAAQVVDVRESSSPEVIAARDLVPVLDLVAVPELDVVPELVGAGASVGARGHAASAGPVAPTVVDHVARPGGVATGDGPVVLVAATSVPAPSEGGWGHGRRARRHAPAVDGGRHLVGGPRRARR